VGVVVEALTVVFRPAFRGVGLFLLVHPLIELEFCPPANLNLRPSAALKMKVRMVKEKIQRKVY